MRKVIGGAGTPLRTLRDLLEWEKGTGVHRPGGVLADPSAAIAMLWMRRTLQFLGALLRRLAEEPTAPMGSLARSAYAQELERYHGWILRKTLSVGFGAMPGRTELLGRLAPGAESAGAAERVCASEMKETVRLVDAGATPRFPPRSKPGDCAARDASSPRACRRSHWGDGQTIRRSRSRRHAHRVTPRDRAEPETVPGQFETLV